MDCRPDRLVELALGGLRAGRCDPRQSRSGCRIETLCPQRISQVTCDSDDGPILERGRPRGAGPADRDRRRAGFGTLVNPFLFVPLAFDPEVEKRFWYRALAVVSFLGVSGGLVAAAIVGPA